MDESVFIPHSIEMLSKLDEIVRWCTTNFGPERCQHPLIEAEEGQLDYYDGEWAFTTHSTQDGWLFWFGTKGSRALFLLTWQ